MTDTTQTPPAAPGPDIVHEAVAEAQKIVVGVENVLHSIEVKVEAGWQWADTEFVYLKDEANKAYNWVKTEDPQLAALVRQQFLVWEQDAANIAKAKIGPLGTLITGEVDSLGSSVGNFVQGVLGQIGASGASKAGVAALVSAGETMLLSAVKAEFAKTVGVLIAGAL